MPKLSHFDRRSQAKMVEERPIVAFIYVAIGRLPNENMHLIKIGRTTTSVKSRLSSFYMAYDFMLTELANIKGFKTILKRREQALEKVALGKNHKWGVPISFEYRKAKIDVKLYDRNMLGMSEELAKHIAKKKGLHPIIDTSGEMFTAFPTFTKTNAMREEIVIEFRTVLAWYYERIVLRGGKLTTQSITDFYDKLISDGSL